VVALLGPNGAGKTTFLLTVAGLLRAQGGSVAVDGRSLPNGRAAAANQAGLVLVPDNRCLFGSLTVEENLKAAAGRGSRTPGELMNEFQRLRERRHVRASALSGGEQQVLAIARALIQSPTCLLIDEMSMGLAPMVVETLFGMVRRIAADHGCAVVLVEQHVAVALDVADRAAVMNRGRIVLDGPARSLLSDATRLEEAYLGTSEPALDGKT
jgi:branched-chain amino acid transport system ATP-binding protein